MTEQVTSTKSIGRIKWFNNKKGFGFLSNCETNEDVFIHHSGISLGEEALSSSVNIFKTVIEGEYVSYEKQIDEENRTVAKNVTGVLGGPLLCENVHKKIFVSNRVQENNSADEGSRSHSDRGGGRGGGRGRSHGRNSSSHSSDEVPSTSSLTDDNAFTSLASTE
tara:strand:+ start:677 stop:1171 length:495 start_codon:yes stop_codon:yes gene_type:complete